jgi:hypothetical protein
MRTILKHDSFISIQEAIPRSLLVVSHQYVCGYMSSGSDTDYLLYQVVHTVVRAFHLSRK